MYFSLPKGLICCEATDPIIETLSRTTKLKEFNLPLDMTEAINASSFCQFMKVTFSQITNYNQCWRFSVQTETRRFSVHRQH